MKTLIKKIRAFLGLSFYTSEVDQFLEKVRNGCSASQAQEIDKYKVVHRGVRSGLDAQPEQKTQVWDKF